jgi:hypothetical protein
MRALFGSGRIHGRMRAGLWYYSTGGGRDARGLSMICRRGKREQGGFI